jgi:hypothetical protein
MKNPKSNKNFLSTKYGRNRIGRNRSPDLIWKLTVLNILI